MIYFQQESERLRFRKVTAEDIDGWLAFFENNDRLHFLGMDTTKPVRELAEGWINKQLERNEVHGLGHLAVIEKKSNQFIGLCGIIPREVDGKKEMEIAYSLKPPFWGQGYGTEMAQHMRKFGSEHELATRFISIIHKENKDSMRVAEKNGMRVLFETEFMGMEVYIYGVELT